jgi:hypothetical protein
MGEDKKVKRLNVSAQITAPRAVKEKAGLVGGPGLFCL